MSGRQNSANSKLFVLSLNVHSHHYTQQKQVRDQSIKNIIPFFFLIDKVKNKQKRGDKSPETEKEKHSLLKKDIVGFIKCK